jgi:hypothetical protein
MSMIGSEQARNWALSAQVSSRARSSLAVAGLASCKGNCSKTSQACGTCSKQRLIRLQVGGQLSVVGHSRTHQCFTSTESSERQGWGTQPRHVRQANIPKNWPDTRQQFWDSSRLPAMQHEKRSSKLRHHRASACVPSLLHSQAECSGGVLPPAVQRAAHARLLLTHWTAQGPHPDWRLPLRPQR